MSLRRRYLARVAGAQARLEGSRPRVVAQLRLAAGLAWLLLAILVFRVPLGSVLRPAAAGTPLAEISGRPSPPAEGILLRVESVPTGGVLWVDGAKRGELPLFTNVTCEEGDAVELRVVKRGFRPWRREVFCREGETLSVEARLGR